METNYRRPLRMLNASAKRAEAERLALAVRTIAEENAPIKYKDVLVLLVRQERINLADAKYAMTFARHDGLVSVDSSTLLVITQ
jgi:hypothetical protein